MSWKEIEVTITHRRRETEAKGDDDSAPEDEKTDLRGRRRENLTVTPTANPGWV